MTPTTDTGAPAPMDASPAADAATRRQVLRLGGLGALGAAFLAACGSDAYVTEPGVGGASETTVPPTIPIREPNSAELEAEQVELHTLASVEILAAQVYLSHASKVLDDELRSAAERYGADHQAAGDEIGALTETGEVDGANEELRIRMVEPVEQAVGFLLESDTDTAQSLVSREVLALFTAIESSLAATYVNSMTTLTTTELRQHFAGNGAAAARRVTVLDANGAGSTPNSALFPAEDLIPGAAYLGPQEEEEAAPADAEAEGEPDADG